MSEPEEEPEQNSKGEIGGTEGIMDGVADSKCEFHISMMGVVALHCDGFISTRGANIWINYLSWVTSFPSISIF